MTSSYESIDTKDFDQHFGSSIELSSDSLASQIISVSDEWFAPATSLLKQQPPSNLSGQFGPNGALYDGWESRRHNPAHDWVIIQLGVPSGRIVGFDIDTTLFNGNEAPACSVYGLTRLNTPPTSPDDPEWQELLPVVPLGPSSRHLFKIPETTKGYRYIKLNMIPDGGIARFRVYGNPIPVFPSGRFDLASVLLGARVVFTSDQHYGVGSNLILPGRGPKSMDGGWETKRSRKPGHFDFVIIKLADMGYLDYVEIDTNYFIGNFPQHVDIFATVSDDIIPDERSKWTSVLGKSTLGPHQQQYFQLSKPKEKFTHVRMTIYPDGGIKRVRVFGRRTSGIDQNSGSSSEVLLTFEEKSDGINVENKKGNEDSMRIPILPLTPAAFKPYGTVIVAHLDSRAGPPEIRSKIVNFGTATKFDHVARIENDTKDQSCTVPNICLFSCQPWEPKLDSSHGRKLWRLKGLERHELSSQTFIPFATHLPTAAQVEIAEFGSKPEGKFLIVVALDDNGKPNMDTVRAFLGTKSQGISYLKNIWHAPLIAINNRMDFLCLIHETGDPKVDCELIENDQIICELVEGMD